MTRHLLVTCDLGWVRDMGAFRAGLEAKFSKVTFAPLAASLEGMALDDVTDWVTDPAPRYRIDSDLVDALMPSLCRIGSPSTGTTHIAGEVLSGGLTVRCLRDVPPEQLARITSSSEHTFFLFLALLRRCKQLFSTDLSKWRDDLPSFRGRQAAGMKVLIFGYGRIGSNLGRYLNAFGAEVRYFEPDLSKHTANHNFVSSHDLLDVVSSVDAVFLCFHWSKENDRFFGAKLLDEMRHDSYLINTSRGENLDELHLAKLIEGGKFAGVALDVMQDEQSKDFGASPLLELEKKNERLIITPHIAGASYDSERIAFELILNEILGKIVWR